MTEFQGLFFQRGEDVGVVGDQRGVDRFHVTPSDQSQGRVPGRGHRVVLAGAHQLDRFVRGAERLDVDLAAGGLLEAGDQSTVLSLLPSSTYPGQASTLTDPSGVPSLSRALSAGGTKPEDFVGVLVVELLLLHPDRASAAMAPRATARLDVVLRTCFSFIRVLQEPEVAPELGWAHSPRVHPATRVGPRCRAWLRHRRSCWSRSAAGRSTVFRLAGR